MTEGSRTGGTGCGQIVLVGLMGVGKSTVGRRLADSLGLEFIDVDDVILARTGRTVRQLWQSGGEAAYRDLERDVVLQTLGRDERSVLAAPGGVVMDRDVRRAFVAPDVVVVWLRGSLSTLVARAQPGDHRPLLGDKPADVLASMARGRKAYFEEIADTTVDVDGLDPHALTSRVLAEIGRLLA